MKKSVIILFSICLVMFNCSRDELTNDEPELTTAKNMDIITKPPGGNGGGGSNNGCDNEVINGNCFGGSFTIIHDVIDDCSRKITITGNYSSSGNNTFSVSNLNSSVYDGSPNGGSSITVNTLNYISTGNGFINVQISYTTTSTSWNPFNGYWTTTTENNFETIIIDPC